MIWRGVKHHHKLTNKSCTMSVSKEDELELLARLQAQFGDLDVTGFMQGNNSNYVPDDDESESSLEEPTAEELQAWQEAQFATGKTRQDAKKIRDSSLTEDGNVHLMTALQRRRYYKTTKREDEKNDDDGWVKVTSYPDLGGKSSVFFPTVLHDDVMDIDGDINLDLAGSVNPLLQKLVEGDPEILGTKWMRLYSSSDGDGLSFRNVCYKIRGYDGPTVLLIGGMPSASKVLGRIHDDDRVSLGFFTTDSWIESSDYFGASGDCFLFSLDRDDVHFIRPKSMPQSSTSTLDRKYMYCHPSYIAASSKRVKDVPSRTNGSVHGMGIGGYVSQPRLHITESLEECRAMEYDHLFDDGCLLLGMCRNSLNYFDVDCIEIWGVGGDEWIADALQAQRSVKAVHAANLEKARKIDKRQLLDDFANGLVVGSSDLYRYHDLVSERCDS